MLEAMRRAPMLALTPPSPEHPASTLLDELRRWGWNATSFQVTKPGFSVFASEQALVAYVDTGSAWVAAGAPIGPTEALGEAARAFVEAGARAGRRVSFFAVEERFLSAARGLTSVGIGEQPVWDPRDWHATVARSRTLRSQVSRPTKKGVSARVVSAEELRSTARLREDLASLVGRWLASRGMPPMKFLVDVQLEGFEDERRCVVAERRGALVGACLAVPVYARRGWFLENVLRAPDAPNGTAELLVDVTMRAIAAEGAPYATLGLAPLAGEVAPWLRVARRAGRILYDFDGLASFKAKLCPTRWDPMHLAFPRRGSSLLAIVDALRAFAGGSLVGFGLRSLVHLAAPLARRQPRLLP